LTSFLKTLPLLLPLLLPFVLLANDAEILKQAGVAGLWYFDVLLLVFVLFNFRFKLIGRIKN
jgi:hypothetical protein